MRAISLNMGVKMVICTNGMPLSYVPTIESIQKSTFISLYESFARKFILVDIK